MLAPCKGISSAACVEMLSLTINGEVILEVGGGFDEMIMTGVVEHLAILETVDE